MSWQQDVNSILEQEPELWLDYLTGRRLGGHIPQLKTRRIRVPGLGLKTLQFLLWTLSKWSPQADMARPKLRPMKFVVLATSRNQINTTSGIVEALRGQGDTVLAMSKKKRLKSEADQFLFTPIAFSAVDLARAFICYRNHASALYEQLKSQCTLGATDSYVEVAKVYLYLAYFYRVLKQVNPGYVITSNDHSAMNRCMLAIAHHLNIKTVYVQHASVSSAFPALLFDYAFLDGPAAAETYALCKDNYPDAFKRKIETTIIYSGQKKTLTKRSSEPQSAVGIAVNKLDDIDSVVRTMRLLAENGHRVIVRWHPRQNEQDVRKLEKQIKEGSPTAVLSNPEDESVDAFLNELQFLIAGNSSIHLEAAIKGVVPLYYEFSPLDSSDYYGYVEKGLARRVQSACELFSLLTSGEPPKLNSEAVRFYSSTFGTEWEGRESELVARYFASHPQSPNLEQPTRSTEV